MTVLKVGQLAARTGLTVRTLHHYDEIGLLSPGQRTAAGHRLYGAEEILRLQQIASLRHLGLSLEAIRDCLETPEYSLDRALELQLERLDEQMDRQRKLRDLIVRLRRRLGSTNDVSIDELTQTIEITMNYANYYSEEQLEQLEQRRAEVGDARMEEAQQEWTTLFSAFEKAMTDGLEPGSPEVKLLARKSAALIEEFTGGDPGIRASLNNVYREEGPDRVMSGHGMAMAPGLWEYMGKARAAIEAEGT